MVQEQRDRITLIKAILEATPGYEQRTDIMFKCRLSHRQLLRYLDYLVSVGMLDIRRKRYARTGLGMRYLEKIRELEAVLP